MYKKLLDAARAGDVQALHLLLKENPSIIHTTELASSENILHISAALGHGDFAKEIIRLKPSFSKEFNQNGFSPLHIAAANGYEDIASSLLKFNPDLCLLQGREKLTPLHWAAIRGKPNIITMMLSACSRCAGDVNILSETALHLAVKNNQFEAMNVMVECIRQTKNYKILNMIDEKGNTVFHLAAWKKQRQVLKLLLQDQPTLGMLEINAVNQSGLTALDLILIFPSEAGDREIVEILQASGAMRARYITHHLHSGQSSNEMQVPEIDSSHQTNPLEYFTFDKGRDRPGEVRSTLLMIATLTATATFQAGMNIPGGFWQDYVSASRSSGTNANKVYVPGKSIFGEMNAVGYGVFIFFNSIGFYLSLLMIKELIVNFPLQLEFELCIAAMAGSYNSALDNAAPDSVHTLSLVLQAGFCPAIISLLWLRKPSGIRLIKHAADMIRRLTCH